MAGGRDIDELFERLARSAFRSKFKLKGKELEYYRAKGEDTIRDHARQFVTERLSPAEPAKDGRQTPMRNHPVFIAQHATATCCRGCLEKWHGIKRGQQLTESQVEYITQVIIEWLRSQTF